MCRYLTEWLSADWMWVTERETFEEAVDALALELRARTIVRADFAEAVKAAEMTTPSGVSDVAVPVAVVDVVPDVVETDGIVLLRLEQPIMVQSVSGETIGAQLMFFVLARQPERKRELHALIDDLLMDDEALTALANVRSRAGVYHMQQTKMKTVATSRG